MTDLAEIKAAVGGIAAEVRSRLDSLENDMDGLLTVAARGQGTGGVEGKGSRPSPEAKAFGDYLRRGPDAMSTESKATLHVSTDPAGGYVCPPEFVRELQRAQAAVSPLRRLARLITTGAGSIEVPRQVTGTTASWVGELELRPATDLTLGMTEIPLHELGCYADVSLKLLDDSAFSIEELLAVDLGEAFAKAESNAFLVGDSIKKPRGILSDLTTGLNVVNSGAATNLLPDALISAVYAVDAQNRREGTWMMSTSTAAVVRKLKDTAQRYLWADGNSGLVPGQPSTLLGYPVEVDDGMPSVAPGSLPILFGNFRRAAWVVSKVRGAVSILVDPFSVRTVGQVRFHARQRVGFGVVRPEALAVVKIVVA